ncbi:hypothetical protein [Variovorax sp. GB1P17]|uniref:hypothetical protein n=1 Tax=Variovorax sp. GB1P17 TaxID=3443740 RepID=UPI003F45C3BA
MNRFDREDAEAIFRRLLERADEPLLEVGSDGVRIPKALLRDSDARPFHWSPACEVDGPNAPNPLVVPSLPFPFDASELAAFMVDGVGAHLGAHFGPWEDGPDAHLVDELGDMATRAKQALREAYTAYRRAAEIVGPRPKDLEWKAQLIADELRAQNQMENIWVKLYEQGISDEEREARRERARTAVAGLKAASAHAAEEASAAYRRWRKAIVQFLLRSAGVGSGLPLRRTGIVDRAWIEATKLVGRNFTEDEIEGGWPEALEPHRLASLQYPRDPVGQSYLNKAAIAACKNGDLRCTAFEHVDHFPIHDGKEQVDVWVDYLISANEFANWWLAKGEVPAVHVAAWLSACGVSWRESTELPAEGQSAGLDAADGDGMGVSRGSSRTWWDIAGPHMVLMLKSGQFATAKALYAALHEEADAPLSPFDKGTGLHKGSLFVREGNQPLSLKTVQNKWKALRTAASGN